MTELVTASVALRCGALLWGLIALHRTRHGTLGWLCGLTVLLLVIQAFCQAMHSEESALYRIGEVASLGLSVLLLASVPLAERSVRRQRATQALIDRESERLTEEDARSRSELRARARQQESVANLGRRMLGGSSLQGVFDDAVHTVARTLDVQLCGVFELNAATRTLTLCSSTGALAVVGRATVSALPEHELGHALATGTPVLVRSYGDDLAIARPALQPYMSARSAVAVVVHGTHGEYGVLAVHAREPGRFSEEDAFFLQSIANLLSAGIERDRVLRELERGRQLVSQTEKLQALGTFAGGIAHDLNNQLHAIVGHTQLAAEVVQDGLAQRNLRQVLSAAQRARELTRQVLTFGMRNRPQRAVIDVSAVIDEVVGMVRDSLPSDIDVRVRVRAAGAKVRADSIQLYQVLDNLCTNAIQAMRSGGGLLEIELDSEIVTPSSAVARAADTAVEVGTYVRISVQDTGEGIRPDVLERIFEPFFTARSSGDGPSEGTGMGLAVVHGIVKAHGGTVRVVSEPGRGSKFDILLPCVEATTPLTASVVPSERSGDTLLLVDDEPGLVSMTQQALIARGYDVVALTSSLEALERFRRDPWRFGLVVMDQKMPGMKGKVLAKELLTLRPDLPIILCTGYSDEWTPSEARASGVFEYLLKPFSLDELASAVRRTIERAAARRSPQPESRVRADYR